MVPNAVVRHTGVSGEPVPEAAQFPHVFHGQADPQGVVNIVETGRSKCSRIPLEAGAESLVLAASVEIGLEDVKHRLMDGRWFDAAGKVKHYGCVPAGGVCKHGVTQEVDGAIFGWIAIVPRKLTTVHARSDDIGSLVKLFVERRQATQGIQKGVGSIFVAGNARPCPADRAGSRKASYPSNPRPVGIDCSCQHLLVTGTGDSGPEPVEFAVDLFPDLLLVDAPGQPLLAAMSVGNMKDKASEDVGLFFDYEAQRRGMAAFPSRSWMASQRNPQKMPLLV